MSLTLYHHPRCDSCRKAIRLLEEVGVNYEARDLTVTAPSREELLRMLVRVDQRVRRLFNTSGQRYRELGLSGRIDGMSTSACMNLLSREGLLVKRPFLIGGDVALVGFRETEWRAAFADAAR